MGGLGPGELILIFLVVLLLFGATKLPSLARSMGQASKEFKEGLREGATAETAEGPCPFCGTDVPSSAKFCPGCAKSAEEIVAEREKKKSA